MQPPAFQGWQFLLAQVVLIIDLNEMFNDIILECCVKTPRCFKNVPWTHAWNTSYE